MELYCYKNVSVRGENILQRGVENGKRVKRTVPFQPTLYVTTDKKTEWKSLDGRYMEEFCVGSMLDTNKFIKDHRNTAGLEIHGNTDYAYSYIAQEFSGEVEYAIDDLVIAYIDIETEAEKGFPNQQNPNEKVIAITVGIHEPN